MRRVVQSPLFKNTFWGAGGNAMMSGVAFVAALFVVRNLGPAEYGVLQEMLAYFAIILNFENLINPNIFKKTIIEKPSLTHDYILTMGAFISILGLVFSLGSLALYVIFHLSANFLLLSVLCSGMIFRCSNGISFFFDARLKTIKSQISQNVGNLAGSAQKVAASFKTPTSFAQSFSMPIQYATTAAVHLWQYRKFRGEFPPLRWRFAELYMLGVASFPLFLSTFVDLLKTRFSFMYLGATVTPTDLGLFGAGVKLTEPWLFVASALTISFWPKLVKSRAESPQAYRRTLGLFFGSIFYTFFALTVGGFLFSDFLINTVLGGKYAGSLDIFKVQMIALLFQAANTGFALIEINEDLAHISLIRNLVSLAVCILTLWWLVPLYGINGASVSVVITNFCACIVLPLFFQPTRRIWLALLASPVTFLREVAASQKY